MTTAHRLLSAAACVARDVLATRQALDHELLRDARYQTALALLADAVGALQALATAIDNGEPAPLAPQPMPAAAFGDLAADGELLGKGAR